MPAIPKAVAAVAALTIAAQACTNDFDTLQLAAADSAAASSVSSGAAGGAGGREPTQGGSSTGGTAEGGAGGVAVGGATPGGAGGSGGVPPLASCTDQYGDAPRFQPCVENGEECQFYTVFGGTTSCAAFCTERGGKCNTVYNQGSAGSRCVFDTGTTFDCNGNWNTMICVCTHGCGGGPACTAGTQCDGTSCI